MRTEHEIREMELDASEYVMEGKSAYFGMSYEDGVSAALRWALGEEDEKPVEKMDQGPDE